MLAVQLIVGVICGFVAAAIAASKGRSAVGWFFGGLFIGVIGIVIVACLSNLKQEQSYRIQMEGEQRRLREQLRQERIKGESYRQFTADRLDAHDRVLGVDTRNNAVLIGPGAAQPLLPGQPAPAQLTPEQAMQQMAGGAPATEAAASGAPADSAAAGSPAPAFDPAATAGPRATAFPPAAPASGLAQPSFVDAPPMQGNSSEVLNAYGTARPQSIPITYAADIAWYYEIAGSPIGPISEAEVRQLIRGGSITSTSLLWCEDLGQWTAAGLVAAFRHEAFSS